MTIPFRLLRDALIQLALDPQQQRQVLAGTVVTDELVLDLDNAVASLEHESQRTGITLDEALLSALRELNDLLGAQSSDELWDDESLDTHPTWAHARQKARELLPQLPTAADSADSKDTTPA
ncbi:hypothetical protein [Actinopolymorpha pittospori]|uniref:Uncharacterized protein n=1 Tax=Actinopolymorpha pittospori TaxID=648752 RepID=A0A927MPS7_9ACTN|nr:hypothetical protein [Actinopolymorpha pittospori]MBE1604434.1 hypothetical protein [Actinopolymorpha pittospori]